MKRTRSIDLRSRVRAACACAREALEIWEARYPHDVRPRVAIETAEAWTRGEATIEQVRAAARDAAAAAAATWSWAADAACWAARAAAAAAEADAAAAEADTACWSATVVSYADEARICAVRARTQHMRMRGATR